MSNFEFIVGRNGIKREPDALPAPITFYMDLEGDDIPNEINDGGPLAARKLSVADMLAYLDWSSLKAMSELEYEKFCRGEEIFLMAREYA